MIRYNLLIITLSFCLPIFSKELRGRVVKVTDGDTIVLLDSTNAQHRIRLDGIDCPEKKQPYGNKATQFVRNIAGGEKVTVHWEKKDRYKRILGVVIVDSVNVNEELLRNGLAWHYKYFNNDSIYSTLEQQAKDKRINLWSDKNPIEPYKWRKGER